MFYNIFFIYARNTQLTVILPQIYKYNLNIICMWNICIICTLVFIKVYFNINNNI